VGFLIPWMKPWRYGALKNSFLFFVEKPEGVKRNDTL